MVVTGASNQQLRQLDRFRKEFVLAIDVTRAEVVTANKLIAASTMDTPVASPKPGEEGMTLRWVVVHMIEETARHNGHADLMREAIDGQTGE